MNTSGNASVQVICSPFYVRYSQDAVREFYAMNIAIVASNSLLSIGISLANFVLLVSILSTPSLRTPSYLLISSLALTDLGVGIAVQPLYVWRKVEEMRGNVSMFCALYTAGNVLAHLVGSPSFFIATALSCDRYLAIRLGIRYRQIVSNKRVLRLILCFWLSAGFVVLARLYSRKPKYMAIPAALLFFCLIVIFICYAKAIRLLKTHGIHSRKNKSGSTKIAKFKRSLVTMLLVVICLFACYLPFVFVHIAGSVSSLRHAQDLKRARELTTTILYSNSLFNPLIYFTRSKELRRAFRRVVNRMGFSFCKPTAINSAVRASEVSSDGRLTMIREPSRPKLFVLNTKDVYV